MAAVTAPAAVRTRNGCLAARRSILVSYNNCILHLMNCLLRGPDREVELQQEQVKGCRRAVRYVRERAAASA